MVAERVAAIEAHNQAQGISTTPSRLARCWEAPSCNASDSS